MPVANGAVIRVCSIRKATCFNNMTTNTISGPTELTCDMPPASCPACDSVQSGDQLATARFYSCGLMLVKHDGWSADKRLRCLNAFTAAVAQRQRADALEIENRDLWGAAARDATEKTELMRDRDEARAFADKETSRANLASFHANQFSEECDLLREERGALAAQVERLTAVLDGAREYIQHSPGCTYPFNPLYGCGCGLLITLRNVSAALRPVPPAVPAGAQI